MMLQVAAEREVDVLLVSEQPRCEDTLYQDATRRTGIIVCNKKLGIRKHKSTKYGFVWLEVDNVRIYSCYFSPNDTLEKFQKDIDELEASLKRTKGEVLVAGDFNGKSSEWGETRSDRRGDIICEFVARNDLIILNTGNVNTFQRGDASSILDLTISSTKIAKGVNDWMVLDEETLSDHRYIAYSAVLTEGPQYGKAGYKRPSWNPKKLNEDKAKRFLEESRLLASMGWIKEAETLEEVVKTTEEIVVGACNVSMTKRRGPRNKQQVYWWTPELAELRTNCIKARRIATRAKMNHHLREQYKGQCKRLKKEIKKSKGRCWKVLLDDIDNNPWGMAYKIVTKKFRMGQKMPGFNDPLWMRKAIRDLFPTRDIWTRQRESDFTINVADYFTADELRRAAKSMRTGKAPGFDGIPSEMLKIVVKEYPECLLSTYNRCLKDGKFFKNWKKQKLILLRKGNKPLEQTSSYRPLCLLDTMGKLLEGLLLLRLEELICFSHRQYGFRRGRSTTDAILEVVRIADVARRGAGRKKGFCALVAIDIKNAFNSAQWKDIIEVLVDKKIPEYLIRIIEDYLHERKIIYADNIWIEENVTCGVPQGSRLGPFLWNVLYDDILNINLPNNTQLIGYADDTLIISHSDNIKVLELRVNEALFRVKRWLDRRRLQMAAQKTEAVLITDRRAFHFPDIRLGEECIQWKRQITYLGVEIDHRLSFGPHISAMAGKAARTGSNLARMLPNVGGPREAKRRTISGVVHSQLLYAAPVWAGSLEKQTIRCKYDQVQRRMALRVASAYRTVSSCAVLVLASIPPIDLLAIERKMTFLALKEAQRVDGNLPPKKVETIKAESRSWLLEEWQRRWDADVKGRWTHRLITNIQKWVGRRFGEVSYHLSQALTGHGGFNKYLCDFRIVDSSACNICHADIDDAKHTLFECKAWDTERENCNVNLQQVINPDNMVDIMLSTHENWIFIENFIVQIMKKKELSMRR